MKKAYLLNLALFGLVALAGITGDIQAHSNKTPVLGLASTSSSTRPITLARDDINTPDANAVVWLGNCTGTLIAADKVLSSGHCIGGRELPDRTGWCPVSRRPAIDGNCERPSQWYPLRININVGFGNQAHISPLLTVRATHYMIAGQEDIILLHLERRVPDYIARPMAVWTAYRNASFWGDKQFEMAGFGGTYGYRQINEATFRDLEMTSFGPGPNWIRSWGSGGSTIEPGDSGSPLIWVTSTGQRYLIGVCQGVETSGGRYVATFGPGGPARPKVGLWLSQILTDVNRDDTIPLHSWYSDRREDNYTTTMQVWMGSPGQMRSPDYGFVRHEGWVFNPAKPPPAGTIPLYSWYSPSRRDNFVTSNPGWFGYLKGDGERSPDYYFVRLEGYIYPPDVPPPTDTVPLYSWYSNGRGDNYATSMPVWAGGPGDVRSPDYEFVRLEGYLIR
jgi:hypothetical protein